MLTILQSVRNSIATSSVPAPLPPQFDRGNRPSAEKNYSPSSRYKSSIQHPSDPWPFQNRRRPPNSADWRTTTVYRGFRWCTGRTERRIVRPHSSNACFPAGRAHQLLLFRRTIEGTADKSKIKNRIKRTSHFPRNRFSDMTPSVIPVLQWENG